MLNMFLGGFEDNDFEVRGLKSVEVYNHAEDSWSDMPDMIVGRRDHRLVPIRNKLFAIGGELGGDSIQSTEVFDYSTNKFVLLKLPPLTFRFSFDGLKGAFSLENKIVVISNDSSKVACFDLEENKWSEIKFDNDYYYEEFCCLKIPQL